MNFLTLVRHRARSTSYKLQSWPGAFAILQVGSTSKSQPFTPFKAKGWRGEENTALLDLYVQYQCRRKGRGKKPINSVLIQKPDCLEEYMQ